MRFRRKILFYGNSIILGTLAANLRDYPQFEVTTLTPPLPEAQELAKMSLDVLLFDIESDHPEGAFSLLEGCPTLLLVGVSPNKNTVQMWAGRQVRNLSTRGLLKMINEQLKNSSEHLNGEVNK